MSKKNNLSSDQYEYIAHKASHLLYKKIVFSITIISLLVSFIIYLSIDKTLNKTIENEVAKYLETKGGKEVTESIKKNVALIRDSVGVIDSQLLNIEKRTSSYTNQVSQIKILLENMPVQAKDSNITIKNANGSLTRIEWGYLNKKTFPDTQRFFKAYKSQIGATFANEYISPPIITLTGGHMYNAIISPGGREHHGYEIQPETTSFSVKGYSQTEFRDPENIGWIAIGILKS